MPDRGKSGSFSGSNMKIFIYLILLLMIFGCSDEADNTNEFILHLTLQPAEATFNQGENIQLGIKIAECSQPIFGICLQMEFNEEVISYMDSTAIIPGDFFGENCITFAQEENGIIHLTISLVQGKTLLSGSGKLCSLNFNAVNSGETVINILSEEITVYDAEGNILEVKSLETGDAVVTVL